MVKLVTDRSVINRAYTVYFYIVEKTTLLWNCVTQCIVPITFPPPNHMPSCRGRQLVLSFLFGPFYCLVFTFGHLLVKPSSETSSSVPYALSVPSPGPPQLLPSSMVRTGKALSIRCYVITKKMKICIQLLYMIRKCCTFWDIKHQKVRQGFQKKTVKLSTFCG